MKDTRSVGDANTLRIHIGLLQTSNDVMDGTLILFLNSMLLSLSLSALRLRNMSEVSGALRFHPLQLTCGKNKMLARICLN